MAWVTKVRRPDGGEAVLGFHAARFAAMQQADEFNRRYQTSAAYVEPFDPAEGAWPRAGL